jgi:hypothetical protein
MFLFWIVFAIFLGLCHRTKKWITETFTIFSEEMVAIAFEVENTVQRKKKVRMLDFIMNYFQILLNFLQILLRSYHFTLTCFASVKEGNHWQINM